MDKEVRNAYRQGQQAFNDGTGSTSNPYSFTQQRRLRDAWDDGYDDELDRAV